MSLGDEHDGFGGVGGSGQTRTRLPEGNSGDIYGGARRPVRSSRSLITVVGVVVLLIAAIAFANRGGGDEADAAPTTGTAGAAAPTAATGIRPVTGKNGQLPAGFAHTDQGAQSAATNYAVVLGSAEMFQDGPRAEIVRAIHDPAVVEDLLKKLDASYSAGLMAGMGLDENGTAPTGLTFVSRTIPIGTKVRDYTEDSATVEVWCTGLGGLAGAGSTKPVTSTWFTITQKLKWVGGDWRVESFSQSEGPTPVNGDSRASTADEIAEAVEGYGGFTYAR